MAQIPQLFGLIPAGHAPILNPSAVPSATSFVYTIPVTPARPFNHIVVFLLPGIDLPPSTAAAVYLSLPNPSSLQSAFKFLGGIGPGKESAIFKISNLLSNSPQNVAQGGAAEVDMDAPESQVSSITIGISIESADSVSSQMSQLQTQNPTSGAIVLSNKSAQKPDTLLLAQRIIKNAFNFLASFSGNIAGGVEVVPLKAFEEWWRKFEGRVRSDPGFLERDSD
ncbi:hypothetical protein BGZ60DRAFT_388153 [Tricladium varicosporioides]|nr:hypothetical protein BGZ60DRAFT_388153 [Hymenoscyphus varicosporioides]